jgi:hypothetical protein
MQRRQPEHVKRYASPHQVFIAEPAVKRHNLRNQYWRGALTSREMSAEAKKPRPVGAQIRQEISWFGKN